MQKFPHQLKADDRRFARKCSIAVLGFYGSIIAVMAIYAGLHSRSTEYASAGKASQMPLSDSVESTGAIHLAGHTHSD
jgi:hypothetical protein